MQSGNKLIKLLIIISMIGLVFFGLIYYVDNFFGSDISMEEVYNKEVHIKQLDSIQQIIESRLLNLDFVKWDSLEVSFDDLLKVKVNKVYLFDVQECDYSKLCVGIPNTTLLKGKEFCQFAIINMDDNIPLFLRGWCNGDLMNMSETFEKIRFSLNFPIEEIKGSDKIIISKEKHLDSSVYYWIEPKVHVEFKGKCTKAK